MSVIFYKLNIYFLFKLLNMQSLFSLDHQAPDTSMEGRQGYRMLQC